MIVTLHTVHTADSADFGCTWPDRFARPLAVSDIERYQRSITELADVVIVHDAAVANVLLRQGARAAAVMTIPHGTLCMRSLERAAAKAALRFNPECRLLVAPGFFRRSKNILKLIEAFADIIEHVPQARLWIGGHTREQTPEVLSYRRQCEQAVTSSGLERFVRWLPRPVQQEMIPVLFRAADVICCIYDEGTWSASGILHLALGAGTPVIASRIPKFNELDTTCSELLVDPTDASEVAKLARRLLEDAEFREVVIERLEDLAVRSSWPFVATLHLGAYAHTRRLEPAPAG